VAQEHFYALCLLKVTGRMQGRKQGGAKEAEAPPPLSQVKVEKKKRSFIF